MSLPLQSPGGNPAGSEGCRRMQLSIMTRQLSIAALSQHPSLGSRDEAVPWTRDAHFPAGIREVLLPCWESLPIFLLPLARLLGQLTRGSLCLVSTQHGNADQGCLAFRDRQENMGVGKSLLPCRAGAGHATGITQSSARGGLWVLGTLAHCWGTGARSCCPRDWGGEERDNVPGVGFPRAWQCHCLA